MAAIAAAGVGMMVMCCSSSVSSLMMGGGEEKKDPVVKTPDTPSGPACKPDQAFTEQTGTVACESIDDFKPTAATWWGTHFQYRSHCSGYVTLFPRKEWCHCDQ
jgi:hypothetical protein